jgi:hypothetical protein
MDAADSLTQTTITQIVGSHDGGVIERRKIIETANSVLYRFDKTAATIYGAFHRR